MKLLKKIDDKFTEAVGYAVALALAVFGWICGLGMVCVTCEVNSGSCVQIHGWTCHCGDGGEQ
jgi:hypothetical protein